MNILTSAVFIIAVSAPGLYAQSNHTATQRIAFNIPTIKVLQVSEKTVTFDNLTAKDFGTDGTAEVVLSNKTNLTRISNVKGFKVTLEWKSAPKSFTTGANTHQLQVQADDHGFQTVTNSPIDLVNSIQELGAHTYELDYKLVADSSAGSLNNGSAQLLFTLTE